jgi:hypothetical protein
MHMQMIFDLTAKKLISYEPSKSSEDLRKNFVAFIRGLISFPVDIPGTAYHECMQVNMLVLAAQPRIHARQEHARDVVSKAAHTCASQSNIRPFTHMMRQPNSARSMVLLY